MKRSLLLALMTILVIGVFAQEEKVVVTGAGYADDVYYSLENGTVSSVARNNWDLGFTTSSFSVSILANHSSGVEVYTYPMGDTADWATLDTTGMVWTPMFNSLETFDEGAFSANASSHPDYGWGTYNMSTHNITGDSLLVIKTVAGDYKKLSIIKRGSMANTWDFKYANLDGSEEQIVMLNSGDYKSKSFVYYTMDSLAVADSMAIIDREPAKGDWDLLFTKYTDNVNYSPASDVSGILTNEDHIEVQEGRETALDQATYVSFQDTSFSSNIGVIGYDWKKLNFQTFTFDLIDTVVYFIKTYTETDSAYYKLYFTGFTGQSEGKYTFMQEKLSLVSSRDFGAIKMLQVYPNPASDYLNVVLDHSGESSLQIIDMAGRTVFTNLYNTSGFTNLVLDINHLNSGLFFLKVNTGDETEILRFIKQ